MNRKITLFLLVLLFSLFLCSCKLNATPETTESTVKKTEHTEAATTTEVLTEETTAPTSQSEETAIPTLPTFATSEPTQEDTTPPTLPIPIVPAEAEGGLPDNMTEKG